jgi:hypothetical protein
VDRQASQEAQVAPFPGRVRIPNIDFGFIGEADLGKRRAK